MRSFFEGVLMAYGIRWESNLDLACSMALVQEKSILLDFFNPG